LSSKNGGSNIIVVGISVVDNKPTGVSVIVIKATTTVQYYYSDCKPQHQQQQKQQS
jgi:hypothetical protein